MDFISDQAMAESVRDFYLTKKNIDTTAVLRYKPSHVSAASVLGIKYQRFVVKKIEKENKHKQLAEN